VIWDPAAETTITAGTFDDASGDCVYLGERLHGQVRDVLLGGRALVRQGRFAADEPAGTYLPSGNESQPLPAQVPPGDISPFT